METLRCVLTVWYSRLISRRNSLRVYVVVYVLYNTYALHSHSMDEWNSETQKQIYMQLQNVTAP
jgi:hypothetical protein